MKHDGCIWYFPGKSDGFPDHPCRARDDGIDPDLGATLQDLRLHGYEKSLVVGFRDFHDFQDYLDHSRYHSLTSRRVINRIWGARAHIDSTEVRLASNQTGGHMLHGGQTGYGERDLRVLDLCAAHITLRVTSPLSVGSMDLFTTEPGIQFCKGQGLSGAGTCVDDHSNAARSALCLEPQLWPDAPTHPHIPSIALTPNDSYHQISRSVFCRRRP